MNKKKTQKLSFAKLFLTALVGAPLAILPAPLFALPTGYTSSNTDATTIEGEDGVDDSMTIDLTADKVVIDWDTFDIADGEDVEITLAMASHSVLNRISGGAGTTIAGELDSNGRVFILNEQGVVIAGTAVIDVGALTISTVEENDGYFQINGELSFNGDDPSGDITIADGAEIETVGSSGGIWLVGNDITLAGDFEGSLNVRAIDGNVLLGGDLVVDDVTGANNGSFRVTEGNSFDSDGNGMEVEGVLSIAVDGTINVDSANAESVSLSTGGDDNAATYTGTGDVVLAESDVSGDLTITANGALTSDGASAVGGGLTLVADEEIEFLGSGDIELAHLESTGDDAVSVETDGDITGGVLALTNDITLTSSGGSIDLDNAANTFAGDMVFNAADGLTIVADAALSVAGADVGGDTSITTTTDGIAFSGEIDIDGDVELTTAGADITDDDETEFMILGGVTVDIGAGDLVLDAAGSDGSAQFGAFTITSATDVTIVEDTTLNFDDSTIAGILDATSNDGDIIDSGTLDVAGNVTLAVDEDTGSIVLDDGDNDLADGGTITIASASAVSLTNTVTTDLDAAETISGLTSVTLDGAIALTADGDFTTFSVDGDDSTGVDITDTADDLTIQDITIGDDGALTVTTTDGDAGDLVLGSGIAVGDLGATFNAAGDITDSGDDITIDGDVAINAAGSFVLDNAGHEFGGAAEATAGADSANTLTVSSDLDLGDVTIGEDGTLVVSSGGDITDSGIIAMDGGLLSIWASGAVTIDDVEAAGTDVIDGGLTVNAASSDGNVTIEQDGALEFVGRSNIGGTLDVVLAGTDLSQDDDAYLRVYNNTSIEVGAGDVELVGNGTNNFGGVEIVSANDVTITERESLRLNGNSVLAGDLTIESLEGWIVDSNADEAGDIEVAGTALFTANAGSIHLDTTSHNFDEIGFETVGDVYVADDTGDITLDSSEIGGSFYVKLAGGGDILDSGQLVVFSNTTFDATNGSGGDILINTTSNTFGGLRVIGDDVEVFENSTINLRTGSLVTGDATFTTNGDLITVASSDGINYFEGDLEINSNGDVTLADQFSITGTLFVSAPFGDVDLSALTVTGADLNGNEPDVDAGGTYTEPQP